jgi:hypothetical protein
MGESPGLLPREFGLCGYFKVGRLSSRAGRFARVKRPRVEFFRRPIFHHRSPFVTMLLSGLAGLAIRRRARRLAERTTRHGGNLPSRSPRGPGDGQAREGELPRRRLQETADVADSLLHPGWQAPQGKGIPRQDRWKANFPWPIPWPVFGYFGRFPETSCDRKAANGW